MWKLVGGRTPVFQRFPVKEEGGGGKRRGREEEESGGGGQKMVSPLMDKSYARTCVEDDQ